MTYVETRRPTAYIRPVAVAFGDGPAPVRLGPGRPVAVTPTSDGAAVPSVQVWVLIEPDQHPEQYQARAYALVPGSGMECVGRHLGTATVPLIKPPGLMIGAAVVHVFVERVEDYGAARDLARRMRHD